VGRIALFSVIKWPCFQLTKTSIPTPADLKTLEAFAATVRDVMTDSECMTPQEKRKVLKMLRVRVMMSKQSEEIRIEGWFGPPTTGL
jgi:hypothetical protein